MRALQGNSRLSCDGTNIDKRMSKPLKGPSGIVKDIGQNAYDSTVTSPTSKSVGGGRTSLFTRNQSAPLDPWLDQKTNLNFRPPTVRTYARFKGKLDAFCRQACADPESLRREINRRRAKFPIGYEPAKEDTLVRGSLSMRCSDDEQPPVTTQRSEPPMPVTAVTRQASDAGPLVGPRPTCVGGAVLKEQEKDVSTVGKRMLSNEPPPKAPLPRRRPEKLKIQSSDEDLLAEEPKKTNVNNCVTPTRAVSSRARVPVSPSTVPADEPTQAWAWMGGLRGSSAGLPQGSSKAFSPPVRHGWVPAAQGSWQRQGEDGSWLFEPDEGVYFHIPSETLWREERRRAADRNMGDTSPFVIIEPAVVPPCSPLELPPEARSAESSGCSGPNPFSRAESPQQAAPMPVQGWAPAVAGHRWQRHKARPGWLYEPDEGMFFHEDSESLWAVGSADEQDGKSWDKVSIRRVPTGHQALAGTPTM